MPITINTVDASKTKAPVIRTQQTSWPAQRSKGVATTYERALRGVAKEVGKLIKGYMDSDPLNPDTEASLSRALNAYAELIGPWALHIGSEGYIWHTVGDMLVRESHKKMNGKFVKWSEPPTLDNLTIHLLMTFTRNVS